MVCEVFDDVRGKEQEENGTIFSPKVSIVFHSNRHLDGIRQDVFADNAIDSISWSLHAVSRFVAVSCFSD